MDRRRHRHAFLLGLLVVFASDPWETRPWNEWSKSDVARILENSPWVASYSFGALTGPSLKTHVQWRSARPVVAAYVRLVQLANPEVSPDTLQASLADPVFDRYLVISLDFEAADSSSQLPRAIPQARGREAGNVVTQLDLQRFLQFQTAETIKNDAYLTPEGKKRLYVSAYGAPTPGRSAAMFFFERYDAEGAPNIALEDRKVSFTFRMGRLGRVHRDFKLDRMLFKGELSL